MTQKENNSIDNFFYHWGGLLPNCNHDFKKQWFVENACH